jgi:hypothetical protein
VPCHLKLQNHLFGNFQLGADIAHVAITPAFQEARKIPEQPIQMAEWVGIVEDST